MNQSLSGRIDWALYVCGPNVGLASFSAVGGVVELACSQVVEPYLGALALNAGTVMLSIALAIVWSVIRYERTHNYRTAQS